MHILTLYPLESMGNACCSSRNIVCFLLKAYHSCRNKREQQGGGGEEMGCNRMAGKAHIWSYQRELLCREQSPLKQLFWLLGIQSSLAIKSRSPTVGPKRSSLDTDGGPIIQYMGRLGGWEPWIKSVRHGPKFKSHIPWSWWSSGDLSTGTRVYLAS